MPNRTTTGQMLDANSHDTLSFNDSTLINVTNVTTVVAGANAVFHGFLVISNPAGLYTLTAYDANSTVASGLVSSTVVGVLSSTTASGAVPFQWGGDIICNNGLTVVAAGGTTGVVKILYL